MLRSNFLFIVKGRLSSDNLFIRVPTFQDKILAEKKYPLRSENKGIASEEKYKTPIPPTCTLLSISLSSYQPTNPQTILL